MPIMINKFSRGWSGCAYAFLRRERQTKTEAESDAKPHRKKDLEWNTYDFNPYWRYFRWI